MNDNSLSNSINRPIVGDFVEENELGMEFDRSTN
jgi:hypothetical protein